MLFSHQITLMKLMKMAKENTNTRKRINKERRKFLCLHHISDISICFYLHNRDNTKKKRGRDYISGLENDNDEEQQKRRHKQIKTCIEDLDSYVKVEHSHQQPSKTEADDGTYSKMEINEIDLEEDMNLEELLKQKVCKCHCIASPRECCLTLS
jgi:hypothetical protein